MASLNDDRHTSFSVKVDPLEDIDTINIELVLTDLDGIAKRLERLNKGESP